MAELLLKELEMLLASEPRVDCEPIVFFQIELDWNGSGCETVTSAFCSKAAFSNACT